MIISRFEMQDILDVTYKYLCPSNFEHIKNGCLEHGYLLKNINGRGKKATFEIYPIDEHKYSDEIWKSIPQYPGYQASNYGRIKHPKGGILQGTKHKGYIRTRIKGVGQVSNHRLVMMAFSPIDNMDKYVVDHINGIKDDNRVENLRWVLQSENMAFCDENHTKINIIIGQLIQQYGYEETMNKLKTLLN